MDMLVGRVAVLALATVFCCRLRVLAGDDKAIAQDNAKLVCDVSGALKGAAANVTHAAAEEWALVAALLDRAARARRRAEGVACGKDAACNTIKADTGRRIRHLAGDWEALKSRARDLLQRAVAVGIEATRAAGKSDGMIETYYTFKGDTADTAHCIATTGTNAASQADKAQLAACDAAAANSANAANLETVAGKVKAALFDSATNGEAMVQTGTAQANACRLLTGKETGNQALYLGGNSGIANGGTIGGMWHVKKGTGTATIEITFKTKQETSLAEHADMKKIITTLKQVETDIDGTEGISAAVHAAELQLDKAYDTAGADMPKASLEEWVQRAENAVNSGTRETTANEQLESAPEDGTENHHAESGSKGPLEQGTHPKPNTAKHNAATHSTQIGQTGSHSRAGNAAGQHAAALGFVATWTGMATLAR
ncbi:hypothetical protein TRVL_06646 [Trypanosoma vivax]|nr:hypothetical protein TRVL_06646 [Trypanosoma vivax]